MNDHGRAIALTGGGTISIFADHNAMAWTLPTIAFEDLNDCHFSHTTARRSGRRLAYAKADRRDRRQLAGMGPWVARLVG